MNKKKVFIVMPLCTVFILSILLYSGFLSNIQLKLSDSLYGGTVVDSNIVIVSVDDKSLQQIGRWPWDRDVFAKTITLMNKSKIIAVDIAFFERSSNKSDALLEEAVGNAGNVILPVEYTSFELSGGRVVGKEILKPVGKLEEKALDVGYINVLTDSDGVTRAVNSNVGGAYDSFIGVTYNHLTGATPKKSSRMLLNFVGPPGSFKTYSLTDVYNNRVPPESFDGKIVFMGATAPDMHDDYFVPTSEGKAMPGVELHANTLQMLMHKSFIDNASLLTNILLILLSALFTSLIFYYLRLKVGIPILIIIFFVFFFGAIISFDQGIILNLVYVPLSIIFTSAASIIFLYLDEYKAKKHIENAFGKYVSPHILKELVKNPKSLKLGGSKKRITILFSDIRGFTTISEKLNPEQLSHLLNEYLTEMTNVIMDNEGLVDKFIGDAIMALWGAVIGIKEHASLACKAALDMKMQLTRLQEKWSLKGVPVLNIGIGINTGDAVVGNMGSYKRFDFTAIGDSVNLASRLEGVNKQYGTTIIVSETTKKLAKNFVFRELDKVRVKGKRRSITIYELVAEAKQRRHHIWIKDFERGLALYRKQRWDDAIEIFKKLREDSVSRIFIKRCELYKKSPPPKDWDGLFEMKVK